MLAAVAPLNCYAEAEVDAAREEPLDPLPRRRGCRAGRREQQRRHAQASQSAPEVTSREVIMPSTVSSGHSASRPDGSGEGRSSTNMTVTIGGQAALTAAVHEAVHGTPVTLPPRPGVAVVASHRVLPALTSTANNRQRGQRSSSTRAPSSSSRSSTATAAAVDRHTQPPSAPPNFVSNEYELIGAVYDTGRMVIIGQMTVYGLPANGHITMGSQNMHPEATNVTYLAFGDANASFSTSIAQHLHAFVALLNVHWRIPRGVMWFDRGSALWEYEMELSQQAGAIPTPGRSQIHVRFERPI